MDAEYKIIGGDGAEYGPASLDELRSWIGDGRVAGSTQVWRSDLAQWSPAARYAELQQALARLHASVSPAMARQGLRPAGFWPRLGAYVLDRALLTLVLWVLLGPLAQWQHWQMPVVPETWNLQTWQQFRDQLAVSGHQMFPFILLLILLYDVVMNGTFGATLGKMDIGARVVCADGSRLGYSRALLRSLAGRLTEVLFYFGYLWIAMRADKRGMHDLMAGSKVVFQR